ncbi:MULTISPECIES: hypothetical protein [unclassified Empedobacter]|uniref:hypothetical protein n=1 Tax=unclassified Empedobacter TaxID=2643773 RepID=UPI0025C1348C|nr:MULTISPECIES: hypothetical protein [unclassified Empedobacter]
MDSKKYDFIQKLLNDKRLNAAQRDRVLALTQKEIEKDSFQFKTIEERLVNLENITKDKKGMEESGVNNDETVDVFDITYISPKNTYKFLLNFNQNPILKSTCHDIDSNELENIKKYCGGIEYSFKKHLEKVIEEYSKFENQFAPPYLKALIRGYLTGLDYKGDILENGWSSQNIKFNWSSEELLIWSENNPGVPPHLSDGLANQIQQLGFEFSNPIKIKESINSFYDFKNLVIYFKKLFHIRADNSLLKLVNFVNEKFQDQIDFIIETESFPEMIEFFVDVDKFLQAYSKIIELIIELDNLTKPKVVLSLEEVDGKILFGILHKDSIYKKSLINTKERIGDKYRNLINNQINGNCNLILEADFESDESYRLGIWNKKDLWKTSRPKEEVLKEKVGGVKHILEIIKG